METIMNDSINKTTTTIFKQSRTKLWIRSVIWLIFTTIFSISIYKDIELNLFNWFWAITLFVLSAALGFWMKKLIPMTVHHEEKQISISFDLIYFSSIFTLVIFKIFIGWFPEFVIITDIIMCIILGLMSGRLSGTCIRIRELKTKNFT